MPQMSTENFNPCDNPRPAPALAASPCGAPLSFPHHERYARAWYLYNDQNLSNEAKKTLEREMDSAQDDFSWDEFQSFKATLPGYVAHWKAMEARARSALPNDEDERRPRNTK